MIDYKIFTSGEEIALHVRKPDGEEWLVEIEKEYDADLGIEFESATFDAIRRCANKCPFCFIDQNPEGLRSSIYVYDDDYRLSFLEGHFVSLTNLMRKDLERIVRLRLSPLYISIHAMDPDLREVMFGTPKAREIHKQLAFLQENGIGMHGQIVLCPGLNDGAALEHTLNELARFFPAMNSVAVVPVGLTKFRRFLPELKAYDRDMARNLIAWVQEHQARFVGQLGTRFVWPSDEFYLLAEQAMPQVAEYEHLPQVENGVGLVRTFWDQFETALKRYESSPPPRRRATIATGVLGEQVLRAPIAALNRQRNFEIQLTAIPNRFFGGGITATGLVTGGDLLSTLQGENLGDELILPSVMLRNRARGHVFLDDMTLDEVKERLGVPVHVANWADDLVDHLHTPIDTLTTECETEGV